MHFVCCGLVATPVVCGEVSPKRRLLIRSVPYGNGNPCPLCVEQLPPSFFFSQSLPLATLDSSSLHGKTWLAVGTGIESGLMVPRLPSMYVRMHGLHATNLVTVRPYFWVRPQRPQPSPSDIHVLSDIDAYIRSRKEDL